MATIQSISKEILDNFVRDVRTNGEKFYRLKDDIKWQQEIIYASHLERAPSDDIYERIYDILEIFSNLDVEASIEEFEEAIMEIEPDYLYGDLTAWLDDSAYNVEYLTEVLEEYHCKNGVELLQFAQSRYINEIANALLIAIKENLDE